MSVFLSRIVLIPTRSAFTKNISFKTLAKLTSIKHQNSLSPGGLSSLCRHLAVRGYSSDVIQPVIALENATSPVKKKTVYKKAVLEDVSKKEGHFLALAYATANAYDLKGLKQALLEQKLYEPGTLKAQDIDDDVVIANAVYTVGSEPREIIFFKEGAVVFWNCTELEASNVLEFVRRYEVESYPVDVVEREKEIMTYMYQPNAKKCNLQESHFVMAPNRDNSLEKYTFSHAMAQSARLGAWEARLEALAAGARAHSRDMERHGATRLDKKEVVRKLGELFSLRHRINVESDLLDTPDVYWEEERLERLYSNTVAYFTIPRRTRVLNERLSHCVELLELLSSWAADRHHVRLEWMVIALILAEVCFELLHVFERYVLDRITNDDDEVGVKNAVKVSNVEGIHADSGNVKINVIDKEGNRVLMSDKGMEDTDMERIVKEKAVAGKVRVNSENVMREMGMIEKAKGLKDTNVVSVIDVVENKASLEKLEKETENLATDVAAAEVKETIDVRVGASDDTQTKRIDYKQAGIERLAKMERLAENERQTKIKRREELDRLARLQRILAIVRAPEMDSVPKMKQQENLESEKEIQSTDDLNVLKELGVVTQINQSVLGITEKQLAENSEVALEENKKKTAEYEGIGKLERMSKKERILEIDRLINLELEAEAKRNADVERELKLERTAKLELAANTKQSEFDRKADLEKTAKENLAEKDRQEKLKRRQELDRVAKLQRVLVMVRDSEVNHDTEMKQVELDRSAQIKRREEMQLLEDLGILPRQQINEKDGTTEVKPVSEAKFNLEADLAISKGVEPITVVKEKHVDTLNKAMLAPEINEAEIMTNPNKPTEQKIETKKGMVEETEKEVKKNLLTDGVTHVKHAELAKADKKRIDDMQFLKELGILPKEHVNDRNVTLSEGLKRKQEVQPHKHLRLVEDLNAVTVPGVNLDVEIKTIIDSEDTVIKKTGAESEREAKTKGMAEMERKAKADSDARIQLKEEANRVLPNQVFDHNADKRKVEEITDTKRREDMKVLEELGILPKKEVTQAEREINLKETAINDIITEAKIITDDKDVPGNVETNPKHITDIKTTTETEQKAVNEDVDKRLAALRVAQMKRIAELGREMLSEVDLKPNQEEHKLIDSERTENNIIKRKTDENEEVIKKRNKNSQPNADLESLKEKKNVNRTMHAIKLNRDLNPFAISQGKDLEVRTQKEKLIVKLSEVELGVKRLEGIVRVRGRECEWDGQMMYEGRG